MKKSNHYFLCMLCSSAILLPLSVQEMYATAGPEMAVEQQAQKISGTVTDGTGPIVGASVAVKGKGQGTITDLDGHFTLEVRPGTLITISYIGFKTETLKAGNNMKIVLKEDSKMIDEVVVTALGIKREKKALGYGVGEIKGEELQKAKDRKFFKN